MKDILLLKFDSVVRSLGLMNVSGELDFIIERYVETRRLLVQKELYRNMISGSVRSYLDVYNDYENPVLGEMYELEKEMDIYVNSLR